MLFFVLVTIKIAFAAASTKSFGGKILYTTNTKIKSLQTTGYTCVIPGQTITIKPVNKAPTGYFIPAAVVSKTKLPLSPGQSILGLYSPTTTPITCILKGDPPVTTVVNLATMVLFGTSKK